MPCLEVLARLSPEINFKFGPTCQAVLETENDSGSFDVHGRDGEGVGVHVGESKVRNGYDN